MESFYDRQLSSRKHVNLLSAISALDAKQRVTSATRRELSFQVSEFDLSHAVKLGAQEKKLMKTLWQKHRLGENDALRKKLKFAHEKVKTLNCPLQGHAAERVQRTVGFQNVKNRLNSWTTVVQSNRNSDELKFPLNQSTVSFQSTDDIISNWKSQKQTPLEQQMTAILNGSAAVKQNEQDEKQCKLNLKELREYRKEMAKLRALQSYMAAKAKRQKKIKSKRYHRILRSECTKKQLREFETLRKVDPEAALKQLEKLDHARVQERASLRHRNTGRWAHNKAVRAKYDVESRKTLAQQLEISRQLTQKNKMNSSSEDEDEEEEIEKNKNEIYNNDNPWMDMEPMPKSDSLVSNYRKYWQERNHSSNGKVNNNMHSVNQYYISKSKDKTHKCINEAVDSATESQRDGCDNLSTKVLDYINDDFKKSVMVTAASGSWIVTPAKNITEEDDVSLNTSNIMEQKLTMKNNFETSSSKRMIHSATVADSDEEINELALRSKVVAFVDEELDEQTNKTNMNKNFRGDNTNNLFGMPQKEKEYIQDNGENHNVDPNKVIMMKPKYLVTQLPNEISNGVENVDNESDDGGNKLNITEAFADDDVVAEFRREKEEILEGYQQTDIDLTLPGWGEWTGKSIKCSRKKKQTFFIKAPKLIPKNFNKGNVVINDKNDKVQHHQVNELPSAFISVKDFEASIRAPLGNTWIPQTAHQKLIAPSVVTKLGTTIKPLDQDVLVSNMKLNKIQWT